MISGVFKFFPGQGQQKGHVYIGHLSMNIKHKN